MRVRAATRFGWTRALAAKVAAPTLVMAGEYDRLEERRSVYEQLGRPLAEALRGETRLGLGVVQSGETRAGAERFARGIGRHGKF